jgi:hypothetical protein
LLDDEVETEAETEVETAEGESEDNVTPITSAES